jgi:hypothetical protein
MKPDRRVIVSLAINHQKYLIYGAGQPEFRTLFSTFFPSVNRDYAIGTDYCAQFEQPVQASGFYHIGEMITLGIHFPGKLYYTRGTGYNTNLAALALFPVNNYGSFNFSHILISSGLTIFR